MKFFLDTANLGEIRKGTWFGTLDGVTTNPTLPPLHVVEAARMGASIDTMPYKVFEMLFKHPLTERGLELLASDWDKARATLGQITEPAGMRKGSR